MWPASSKKSLAHIFRLADWAMTGILEAVKNFEAERWPNTYSQIVRLSIYQ